MLDFNSHTRLRGDFAERLTRCIDAGIVAREQAKPKREYLGASYLGKPCLRAVQYAYTNTPEDEGKGFSGQTYRRFERGHVMEDVNIGWFRTAGFDIRNEGRDGKQFGFQDAGGRFRGHIDAVICGGPDEFGPYPYLYEHKSVGPSSYKKLADKGVATGNPQYYGQLQIYMAQMQLTEHPALFVCTNADTMELHFERVPFDAAVAQRLIDKAVQVIAATDAGETLPRGFASQDNMECRFCAFAGRCWA